MSIHLAVLLVWHTSSLQMCSGSLLLFSGTANEVGTKEIQNQQRAYTLLYLGYLIWSRNVYNIIILLPL